MRYGVRARATKSWRFIRVEHKRHDIPTCSGGDSVRNCLLLVMAKLLFCGFWMVTSCNGLIHASTAAQLVHSGRSARVAHCARQEFRFPPSVCLVCKTKCLIALGLLGFCMGHQSSCSSGPLQVAFLPGIFHKSESLVQMHYCVDERHGRQWRH